MEYINYQKTEHIRVHRWIKRAKLADSILVSVQFQVSTHFN